MTILSENLRVIRGHFACTQMSLGETLGTGFRTYIRDESGKRVPPVSILLKISRLCGFSLDQLLKARINQHYLKAVEVKLPALPTKLSIFDGSLEEGSLILRYSRRFSFI